MRLHIHNIYPNSLVHIMGSPVGIEDAMQRVSLYSAPVGGMDNTSVNLEVEVDIGVGQYDTLLIVVMHPDMEYFSHTLDLSINSVVDTLQHIPVIQQHILVNVNVNQQHERNYLAQDGEVVTGGYSGTSTSGGFSGVEMQLDPQVVALYGIVRIIRQLDQKLLSSKEET